MAWTPMTQLRLSIGSILSLHYYLFLVLLQISMFSSIIMLIFINYNKTYIFTYSYWA